MLNKNFIEKQREETVTNYVNEAFFNMGLVISIVDDVVYVMGLILSAMSEQTSIIASNLNLKGIINYLDNRGRVGLTILGNSSLINVGFIVKRLKKQPLVKAGSNILGRVVNCVGEAIDGLGDLLKVESVFVEKEAPNIIVRQPVNEPLETGVKFIDSMIPIGCGQRELIIGDSKTGKTSIAIDSIINQKGKEVICVYVAIGQRASGVRRLQNILYEKGCLEYTSILVASASDSSVMQYMSPFSGCAIAEYFMLKGAKALVIYDDLSKHAVAYRQMSLLLRRPPGREGYPGDVFYLHSRLLERSARLADKNIKGLNIIGGSLTAFPIIETIDGDVAAYIPTNVISITDGQIYLEKEVFNKGILPAISPGISVSRVGSAAQNKIIKELSGSLKLELAQYRELEEFARLGLNLDEQSKFIIVKGERLQWLMTQPQYSPVNMINQVALLLGGLNGMFNEFKLSLLNTIENKLNYFFKYVLIKNILNELIRKESVLFVLVFLLYNLKNNLINSDEDKI